MNVTKQDTQLISVRLDPREAAHLLDGLKLHRQALGKTAEELEQCLLKAGIVESVNPAAIRYEYMPPE